MRYLITGGSGYIGGRLTEILSQREETERIVNFDVREPASTANKATFVKGDVRDREAIQSVLTDQRIDCLIHLAFLLDPIHDEARMYDIDVNGTQAVLWAASEAGTGQVFVTSSASAYGAFPDNPRPIAEDWPVRGAPDFSYARHKAEADRICQLWAAAHPDRVIAWVRPCIVFGPNVNNYIVRNWDQPFFPVLDGVDEELQLVHEDDTVSAIIGLIEAKAEGPFNVAGDGTMRYSEAAELLGMKTRQMPFRRAYRIYSALWKLHLRAEAPAGSLNFIRYPWIVSNEKLKATIDWQPRTTREVFEETMRARGKLPAGAPASDGVAVKSRGS